MSQTQSDIYKHHHKAHRQAGFSIMKAERGELLKEVIGKGKTILDIGCRDGALTSYFVEGNTVFGVDIDDTALAEAAKFGIETMKVDLNGDWYELLGQVFDVAVAGEVLEHVYFPEHIAGKVAGLLRPGGLFIGSVPNAFSLKNRLRYLFGIKRNTPLSDPTHITQFHIEELRGILLKHFSQVEIRGLGRYAFLAGLLPGFFAFDLFFICRK